MSQFDSSLGTLTSIVFNYGGQVSTTFDLESRDAAATTVTANAAADLTFGGPISSVLNILGSTTQNFSAFDGVLDFGGTSGASVGPVNGTDSGSLTLLSAFAPYIGSGTFTINVDALGKSGASGAGNLVSVIATQALANISVTYNYDVPTTNVPEPAMLGLMGLGFAAMGAARRRRQA